MNLTPISANRPSFSANLVRQTYPARKQNSSGEIERISVPCTEEEFLDSYDSQIRIIEKQKQHAIELDAFMHTNPEVQELLDKLPEDTDLEICGNLCTIDNGSDSEIGLDTIDLLYDEETVREALIAKGKDGADYFDIYAFEAQNEDGSINKKGIIGWLKNLVELVN